ncbi:MAG: DUF3592 domain-containing protein [Pseudomonadota bacterium]
MTYPEMGDQGLPLHPALRKPARWLKLGLAVMSLAAVVMVLVMGLLFFKVRHDQPLGMLLTVAAAPGLILVVMVFFLGRTLMGRFKRASATLHAAAPREMIGRGLGVGDLKGWYLELREKDGPPGGPPWGVAAVNASKKAPLPKKPFSVTVHLDESSPDNFLVMLFGKQVPWGTLTTPESRNRSWKTFRLFMAGLLACFALVLAALVLVQGLAVKKARDESALAASSLAWPQAEGVIIASEVKDVRISRGKGSVPGFKAEIEYEYTVDGRVQAGERIFYGYAPSPDRSEAERLVKAYPPGSKVFVSHDPRDPGTAVIEPGYVEECEFNIRRAWLNLIPPAAAGLVGFIIILVVLIVMERRRNRAFGPIG